jgi:beta-galactosidase
VDRASGEVDGVRLPKEAYYVCQAMFRDDPQVHIIGHWTYPAGTRKTVYVTSNCQDVKLFVNGKADRTGEPHRSIIFYISRMWRGNRAKLKRWPPTPALPVATNAIRTAGAPVALRLTPITGPGGLQADGSDVAFIDVEAVDATGRTLPDVSEACGFHLHRPGGLARRI